MVFMHRSGSAALKIIANIDHCASDFLDAIVLAVPRVQSLHILSFQGCLTRFVQQLTASAPILEAATFNRSFQWYSEEGGLPPSPRHVLFPTTLFSGYAPRLRDLSMSGCCPVNVPVAAFASITSLRASESFSIYDTMYFLSQAAGLVALDIGPSAFDYHLLSVGHARIIHLPNMTKLRVWLLPMMVAATAFLSALHVSHLSQLDVSISVEHMDHDLAQHVLHTLLTLLAILMKHIQEWDRLAIVFGLSHVSAEFEEPLEHSGFNSNHDSKLPLPPFIVSWSEGSDSDSDLECMLLWTLDILPLDEVTFLSIIQGYEPSGR
ncbi:hypothetical protein EWM64_g947 [Hericium alpestre]|uniref:Uncharacterized protein n=1 Tax=Hericium alpestre TaxID=135208 RepID=A0A4Z0AAS3_9AGAM|nr:hypothetical protein EWM64_g947 [Hericium alpestre]